MNRRVGLITLGLTGIALIVGCSSDKPKMAKVSGVVTLDGKPLPHAFVSFQPMAQSEGSASAGPGSVGKTDEQGRFKLYTDRYGEGAVVGTHRVRITIVPGHGRVEQETNALGTPDNAPGAGAKGQELDPIPLDWNERSKVDFEVTAAGTDKANFEIVTKKDKK
jgi:hypothetical protein